MHSDWLMRIMWLQTTCPPFCFINKLQAFSLVNIDHVTLRIIACMCTTYQSVHVYHTNYYSQIAWLSLFPTASGDPFIFELSVVTHILLIVYVHNKATVWRYRLFCYTEMLVWPLHTFLTLILITMQCKAVFLHCCSSCQNSPSPYE